MTLTEILWLVCALPGCLYWGWLAVGAFRVAAGIPRLDRVQPPEPDVWPKLSVIVPACNEGDKIKAAATTLARQDYPDLEILLINDRSTDDTGLVIERVAAAHHRVRALHVDELPAGWLGKVHALQTGYDAAGGEWVLLTDADVHFAPGALRRVIAWAVERGIDHVAAAPEIWPSGWLVDAAVSSFMRGFCVGMKVWAVEDPRSGAYIGVGAFNLVRRAAFDRTEGFAWLRLEVADDVGVGLLMKRHGARSGLINGVGQVGLHWYRSPREMLLGAEKGYASLAGCSVSRMLAFLASSIFLECAPWATLVAGLCLRSGWLLAAAAVMIIAQVLSAVTINRFAGRRILPGVLAPLIVPFTWIALVRITWLGWRRGGVMWRGTLYPSRELREGKRVWIGRVVGRFREVEATDDHG